MGGIAVGCPSKNHDDVGTHRYGCIMLNSPPYKPLSVASMTTADHPLRSSEYMVLITLSRRTTQPEARALGEHLATALGLADGPDFHTAVVVFEDHLELRQMTVEELKSRKSEFQAALSAFNDQQAREFADREERLAAANREKVRLKAERQATLDSFDLNS